MKITKEKSGCLKELQQAIQLNEMLTTQIKNDSLSYTRSTIQQDFSFDEDKEFQIEDDILSRLKISNEVLIKSNIDLKNKNKILQHEISQYKNSAIYKNPYSQYDADLNEFIQNLKNSLETAHLSNEELKKIIETTQEQKEKLSQSNEMLTKNFEICKNEYEKILKENSELKATVELRNNTIEKTTLKLKEQTKSYDELNQKLETKEKELQYLNTLNQSNHQTQADNEEIINQLKAMIENMQKGNTKNLSLINDLKSQKEELNQTLIEKMKEVDYLKEEISNKEKEFEDQNAKINELEKVIEQNKLNTIQFKNDIQKVMFEKEKVSTQAETLMLFLNDREKTIQNLQSSIAFLTKTFDNDLSAAVATQTTLPTTNSNYSTIDAEMIKDLKGKIQSLKDKNAEQEKQIKGYQKEIDEYFEQFEQSKNDYQLLYQKYIEQSNLVENLKNEFMNKRKDEKLNELIRANEEITKKLQRMQIENECKTNELNYLKKNYDRVSNQLMESMKK